MTQSLDTKLARTAVAMSNCEEDQPIDFCHIVAVREAREEISRLTSENAQLLSDVRTLQAEVDEWRHYNQATTDKEHLRRFTFGVLPKTEATDESGALTRWRTK